MIVPFCKPVLPNFNNLEYLLKDSMRSGHLSNFGNLYHTAVNLLIRKLGLHEDVGIVLTSSGHTALMAAYAALDVKRLVVPSYTFEATRAAATLQGIGVKLADVSPETGCLDVESLSRVPNDSYDSVVVVAALSTIPDLDKLSEYCKGLGKKLIVDGAPTFGTGGIYNYGDAYCLSFHATKTLPIGEGGAVILNSDLVESAKQYITFGFDKNKNVKMTGINGKLSEYSCAILVDLLGKIDWYVDKRIRNLEYYKKRFGYLIPQSFVDRTVYCSLPIVLNSEKKARNCLRELNSKGVQALQYYKPLDVNFEVSNSLYKRNVCLPIHHGLSCEDLNFICDTVLDAIW